LSPDLPSGSDLSEITCVAGEFFDLASWAVNALFMLAKAINPASNSVLIVIERSPLSAIL
jgi:hypothetical protein